MRKYTNDTYCCLFYLFILERRLPFIRGNIDERRRKMPKRSEENKDDFIYL